jgi:hypothetical protein
MFINSIYYINALYAEIVPDILTLCSIIQYVLLSADLKDILFVLKFDLDSDNLFANIDKDYQ